MEKDLKREKAGLEVAAEVETLSAFAAEEAHNLSAILRSAL